MKLDDAQDVDEQGNGEEEAPDEHTEDPEGSVPSCVTMFHRGHKTECCAGC